MHGNTSYSVYSSISSCLLLTLLTCLHNYSPTSGMCSKINVDLVCVFACWLLLVLLFSFLPFSFLVCTVVQLIRDNGRERQSFKIMAEKGKRRKGEAKAELHVPQLLKSDGCV